MKPIKILSSFLLVAGIATLIFFGCKNQNVQPRVTSNAKGGTVAGAYDPVTLTCAGNNTQSTIALTVTAGASGAPAGFSIQWMTKAQFDALNDVWPADTTAFCKASFSGVPYGAKNTQQAGTNSYNLGSYGSVTVYIGDLLNDELNQQLGLSTDCTGGLICGTQYVFRAFAHANSTKNRSAFSFLTDPCATTAACGTCNHFGFGQYKHLGNQVAGGVANWPGYVDATTSLTIGGTSYTYAQCLAILNQSPNGNGLVILAHQLIAAELNNIGSTCPIDVTAADAPFTGKVIPPIGTDTATPASVAGLVATLHGQNENCTACQ
jgi:hypothetical protein